MARKRRKNTKTHVIKDRVFKKLWDAAGSADGAAEHARMFTNPQSDNYIDFYKEFGMGPLEASKMLEEIYKKRNMTFRQILEQAGKRKSQVSNAFCIPIRTVEAWYDGTNPCSPYIKLMLLRHYYLLNLGKWVRMESDMERAQLKPAVYAPSEARKAYRERKGREGQWIAMQNRQEEDDDADDMEFMKKLDAASSKQRSGGADKAAAGKTGCAKKENGKFRAAGAEKSTEKDDFAWMDRLTKKEKKEKIVIKTYEDYIRLMST